MADALRLSLQLAATAAQEDAAAEPKPPIGGPIGDRMITVTLFHKAGCTVAPGMSDVAMSVMHCWRVVLPSVPPSRTPVNKAASG